MTELADLSKVRCFRALDSMTLLTVIHVREVRARAAVRSHPVTLEARRMSLLNGEFNLAGICVFDSLMTIGAPGALTGCKLRRRELRWSRCDWLEFEAFGQRLSMLHMRKIYSEIASQQRVKPVRPLLEVEKSRSGS